MCFAPKIASPAVQQVAATDNAEANRLADIEASLRRRRAGAAANIITGPRGIPSTAKLGAVAA